MIPKQNETVEKGCGPNIEPQASSLTEDHKGENPEQEHALLLQQVELLEQCLQSEEELKEAEGDEEVARLAEETVRKTYIEKRVDRLLQDIETE